MMLATIVQLLQLISGTVWLLPIALFTPPVVRIWKAPRTGPSRPDPIDVLVSPLCFVAVLQVGFAVRWLLFPHSIAVMGSRELAVWAGLYTLSVIAAVGSVLAWSVARRVK